MAATSSRKRLLLPALLLALLLARDARSCASRHGHHRSRSHHSMSWSHSSGHKSPSHTSEHSQHGSSSHTSEHSQHGSPSRTSDYSQRSYGSPGQQSGHSNGNPSDMIAVQKPKSSWLPSYPLSHSHYGGHHSARHSEQTTREPARGENKEEEDSSNPVFKAMTDEAPKSVVFDPFFKPIDLQLIHRMRKHPVSAGVFGSSDDEAKSKEASSTARRPATDPADAVIEQLNRVDDGPSDVLSRIHSLNDLMAQMEAMVNDNAGGGKKSPEVEKKAHAKRSVGKYYETASTSCGARLCRFSPGYPYERINDAVNLIREMLTSRNRIVQQGRWRVDREVLEYQPKPVNVQRFYDKKFVEEGCEVHVNVTRPMEGISLDDKESYYIVNIPSFQQRVELLKCESGNLCNNIVESPLSTCQQTYRFENLLVLPNTKQRFDISDFKVRSFQVPNGCECRARGNDI